MSALVQLPTAKQLLEVADFDQVLAMLCEVVEAETDLESLHGYVQAIDTQADVLRRLSQEVEDATRASLALDRVAVFASLCLGKRLAELDGGGRGKPRSERTEACEEIGIDTDRARTLVKLAEVGDARVLELVDDLEAAGKRPSPWALVKASSEPGASEERDGDESYTPSLYTDAAEEVFGQRPDADPASCVVAQRNVGAGRFWTKAEPVRGPAEVTAKITGEMFKLICARWGGVGDIYDADGEVVREDETIADPKKRRRGYAARANRGRLSHASELEGKVWANPPFAFPLPFVLAIILGYLGLDQDTKDDMLEAAIANAVKSEPDGPITEAIVLVNVGTATRAQQLALLASSAQCWVKGRINFNDATGEPLGDANRYDQVFFYFGPNPERFAEVFSEFGRMTTTWRKAA